MTWLYECPMGGVDGLARDGAILVGKLRPDRQTMALAAMVALEVPYREVSFMVDTGATRSMIARSVAQVLGLRATGRVKLRGITHEVRGYTAFAATLEVPMHRANGDENMVPIPLTLAGIDEHPGDEHHGLLGRDFLREFTFGYHGPSGRFALQTERDWHY